MNLMLSYLSVQSIDSWSIVVECCFCYCCFAYYTVAAVIVVVAIRLRFMLFHVVPCCYGTINCTMCMYYRHKLTFHRTYGYYGMYEYYIFLEVRNVAFPRSLTHVRAVLS